MAIALSIVALFAGPAAAETSGEAGNDGARMVAEVAGVYRERSRVVEADDRYVAESVMEIVPVGGGDAYVRLRTMWAHHHQCSIYGIFHADRHSLIHRSRTSAGEVCRFTIERRADRFVIHDPTGQCDGSCGPRGSFDGDDRFRPGQRRPVRYLARILASDEYRAAIAAHRGRIPRSDTTLLPDLDKQKSEPAQVVRPR